MVFLPAVLAVVTLVLAVLAFNSARAIDEPKSWVRIALYVGAFLLATVGRGSGACFGMLFLANRFVH
jgi:hypothetical protein